MDKTKQALRKAIALLGGRTAFASRMKTSPQRVDYWTSDNGQVTAEVCPTIERETERKVTCEQLRPDVDWAYLRECAK